MKTQYILIALVGALLLAACQTSNSIPAPTELPASTPVETFAESTRTVERALTPSVPVDSPAEPSGSLPPVKLGTPSRSGQKMALLSQTDLSKRLNVNLDAITVKTIHPVIWPDTSLGCPKPDFVYAQVLTNGFIVVLEVAHDEFLYTTDEESSFVFCPKPSIMPNFPVTPSDIRDGKPWMPVD